MLTHLMLRAERREGDLFQGRAGCVSLFTLGTVCSDLPGTQAVPLFCLTAWAWHSTDPILTEGKEK